MTLTLEDRLATAAAQLDRRIEQRMTTDVVAVPIRTGTPTRALAVVACSATLVIGGLVWLSHGDVDDPTTASSPTVPASAVADPTDNTVVDTTALDPRVIGCGVTVDDGTIVASALDLRGRAIDFVVVDRPDVFAETLLFDGGKEGSSGGCSYEPLSAVHPGGTWTSVGYMTSAQETEAYVQGRLLPGAGPHDVTLSTGDVVRVTPTPDGWFVTVAVIPVAMLSDLFVTSTDPVADDAPPGSTEVVVPAVPVADAAPLAIGESVMLGAVPQLQAGGFVIDASESRQGESHVDVVSQLGAAGEIGETVVLQVGTNGPVAAETYDAIVTVLADVDQVVFLTVHAPGKGWIESNNALIYELPGRYPNVQVLDWGGLVASGQVPGLAGDGIHLGSDAAKQFYANYIFGILGRDDLVQPLPV